MGIFSLGVYVDFVEREMFGHLLVVLVGPSKNVLFDRQVAPGS